jgi:dolichol-phosphate mannosyltransferase|tara:strand:+ start:770 stop:1486 length:717 start_codon:yes stop_codon:yes gene_type:complete
VKKIAIIIPTFNELDNIENLIKMILTNVPESSIFIVDDSKDTMIGNLISSKDLKAKYFHRENSRGRGSAVLYGLNKALEEKKFDIFVEMDADFSHNPEELRKNINKIIDEKLDLLIASRYLKNSKIINWGLQRRVLSKLSNFLARILLGIKLKDFTNGFRFYSKRAAEKITKKCGNIGDGFIILSEIIVVLNNNNFKIDETNTIFFNRVRGESSVNVRLVLASLYGIIKLYFIKNKLI